MGTPSPPKSSRRLQWMVSKKMGAIMKKPATNVMTFDICKQRKRDFFAEKKNAF